MNSHTFDNPVAVAKEAARHAVDTLRHAIQAHGSAIWVLSGGTTPNLAYDILTHEYLDQLDWSKVIFVIGDERIGPLNGPDNNWSVIEEALLQHLPNATFLRPKSNLSSEKAAIDYETRLMKLAQSQNTVYPRFTLVWLGMGPDGHTLSLFPGHPDFKPTDAHLVTPVHNSPKPPADRISLTLQALTNAESIVILATGKSKRDALSQIIDSTSQLPIAQAAATNNHTLWLLDKDATP